MENRVGLVAYKVIEAVGAVCVDEAVTHSLPGFDALVDVGYHFKGCFDAVLVA